jgi:hypothetical protein
MEPLHEALRLLKRKAELEEQMRRMGVRVADERELFALRARLETFPVAVRAVLEAAKHLHRPVDALSPADIEKAVADLD